MSRPYKFPCPACKKESTFPGIQKHTMNCRVWKESFGEPFPITRINFNESLYEEGLVENHDYVSCQICAGYGWDIRSTSLQMHIRAHGMEVEAYETLYPNSPTYAAATKERRLATNMERFGGPAATCDPEVRKKAVETNIARYGVPNPLKNEEIKQRSRDTNLARYGVTSPMKLKETQDKVKQAMLDKYGVENAFQHEGMKAKSRETMLERYGVEHNQQNKAVQQRTLETKREKYGRLMGKSTALYSCTACGERMGFIRIHEHTESCASWREKFGAPFPKFNLHFEKILWHKAAKENVDYLQCKVCAEYGYDTRFRRISQHVAVHGMTPDQYRAKYQTPLEVADVGIRRSQTVLRKYGVTHIAKTSLPKEGVFHKYGVWNSREIPGISEKISETNLARYGAENPFASKEVQGKIRETMRQRYGADHPAHVPEILAKTNQTNLKRYGHEWNIVSEDVRAKTLQTNLERYGAKSHMQNPESFARYQNRIEELHGVKSVLSVPDIQKKSYETNLRNHGGKHSSKLPKTRERCRQTCLEKYGVDNPSKSAEVQAKIVETWMRNYGVPFPPTSRQFSGINKPERRLNENTPDHVLYTGDFRFWIRCENNRNHNPDFVVLTDAQWQRYQEGFSLYKLGVRKVVEVFGDYWHGPTVTGETRDAHVARYLQEYASAGIECLIIWESELDDEETWAKIQAFSE